jgi:hypothetical protein
MQEIPHRRHAAFHSFLIDRHFGSEAIQRSTALRLTRARMIQSRLSGIPVLRFSLEAMDQSFIFMKLNNRKYSKLNASHLYQNRHARASYRLYAQQGFLTAYFGKH